MFRTENINVASFVTMVTVLVPGMGFLLHGSVCVLYVDVLFVHCGFELMSIVTRQREISFEPMILYCTIEEI